MPSITTKELSEKALKYANTFILLSSTDAGTGTIEEPKEFSKEGHRVVKDVRDYAKTFSEIINLDDNILIKNFDESINATKKYSIGNCNEFAQLALDFVVIVNDSLEETDKKFNAELYTIENGDHAFLVIGRAQPSVENDPMTWGPDAYICDPFSNEVYPAKEYMSKLKAYGHHEKGDKIYHYDLDYNKEKHGHDLVADNFLDTERLDYRNHAEYKNKLTSIYQLKMESLIKNVEDLIVSLKKISDDINQNTSLEKKQNDIEAKIENLNKIIDKIKDRIVNPERDGLTMHEATDSYRKLKNKLTTNLTRSLNEVKENLKFENENNLSSKGKLSQFKNHFSANFQNSVNLELVILNKINTAIQKYSEAIREQLPKITFDQNRAMAMKK